MIFDDCVIYDRTCINCGECTICDLTPKKKCDNCCTCINEEFDYKCIEIDEIIEEES